MIVHPWGEVEYNKAREMMQKVHTRACKDRQNHLILCSHPKIFTVGYDEKRVFSVKTVKTDRGGSVTCHSPGQNIYYFCFQVPNPAKFYKKVILVFEKFFDIYLPIAKFDKRNPGFYIENRKISSLGFRYSKGVSLHGVALNIDIDLEFHSQVNPCNLRGVIPTSLKEEGVSLTSEEVDKKIVTYIKEIFNDTIQAKS